MLSKDPGVFGVTGMAARLTYAIKRVHLDAMSRRHEGQKIFLRQQAAQRWVEWRESVLQGERPNKFNQAQLLACDHQLRAVRISISWRLSASLSTHPFPYYPCLLLYVCAFCACTGTRNDNRRRGLRGLEIVGRNDGPLDGRRPEPERCDALGSIAAMKEEGNDGCG